MKMANLIYRPRRLRSSHEIRSMVQETHFAVSSLVYPLFVVPGKNINEPINSMPGICHMSADKALYEAELAFNLGITSVILFGIPEYKNEQGTGAFNMSSPVQETIKIIKEKIPKLTVITDVCLCQYTSHGHCGFIKNGKIDNDSTLKLLEKTALSHAEAGADIVAPSDMMDGRVGAIRNVLDLNNFQDVSIMSYAAKYASAYYGPFREAVNSTPEFGDRKTYQMDPANVREALKEVELDIDEGADIVIVKPALAYMDVIYRVKENYLLPVAAYNVSGEYAMVKQAAQKGLIDEKRLVMENMISMRRAGANIIITYHALDIARWLQKGA